MLISADGVEAGDARASGDAVGLAAGPATRMQSFKLKGGARAAAAFFIGLCLLLPATSSYSRRKRTQKSTRKRPVRRRSKRAAPSWSASSVTPTAISSGSIAPRTTPRIWPRTLEEVGFDKKNIKVATDSARPRCVREGVLCVSSTPSSPATTSCSTFPATASGVEADQTNYLLFADLKSPFSYAKSQMSDQDRRNPDVVRLRISQYLDAYQTNEITKGVSANEIQRRIAEKNPKVVIMILDACRSLVQSDARRCDKTVKLVKRGDDSGSRSVESEKAAARLSHPILGLVRRTSRRDAWQRRYRSELAVHRGAALRTAAAGTVG